MELQELKAKYDLLAKKYSLPSFKEVNQEFEIDRIERDSDCLLRSVRKVMMDKILKYIQFFEMIINPSQAPPAFLFFVKNVSAEDKSAVEKAYSEFIKLEIVGLKLEIDYNEKNEADFISSILSVWNEMKPFMRKVISMMEKNWNRTSSDKVERAYLG